LEINQIVTSYHMNSRIRRRIISRQRSVRLDWRARRSASMAHALSLVVALSTRSPQPPSPSSSRSSSRPSKLGGRNLRSNASDAARRRGKDALLLNYFYQKASVAVNLAEFERRQLLYVAGGFGVFSSFVERPRRLIRVHNECSACRCFLREMIRPSDAPFANSWNANFRSCFSFAQNPEAELGGFPPPSW